MPFPEVPFVKILSISPIQPHNDQICVFSSSSSFEHDSRSNHIHPILILPGPMLWLLPPSGCTPVASQPALPCSYLHLPQPPALEPVSAGAPAPVGASDPRMSVCTPAVIFGPSLHPSPTTLLTLSSSTFQQLDFFCLANSSLRLLLLLLPLILTYNCHAQPG